MSMVVLAPSSELWPLAFGEVRDELLVVFSGVQVEVEHIGSTSVPGLSAKPVLDVLLGAASFAAIEQRIAGLERVGYEYRRSYEQFIPDRRYFVRPESETMRVHLHAVVKGGSIWQNHLHVRDALRRDPHLREEYQSIKVSLATRFHNDKDAYTAAKDPFIRRVLDDKREVD